MARKQVVEIHCDRCKRVEHRTEEPVAGPVIVEKALVVRMNGKEMVFEDLCSPCRRAVESHIEAATKKIDGLSPDRKEKEDVKETASSPSESKEPAEVKDKPSEDKKKEPAKQSPSSPRPVVPISSVTSTRR